MKNRYSFRNFIALPVLAALALAGCSSDPLGNGTDNGADGASDGTTPPSSKTLVIGSQDYYSNEIIAEIYALALEDAGFTVKREMRIGQREVYMPELESGNIDVFPEYTGNLLQYYQASTKARTADDVYLKLSTSLPSGLRVLDQADASDQDSYVVTTTFADKHQATKIGDLAGIPGLLLGGNSELETRPYGPEGLASVYNVQVGFTPIEDSGGPLTLKALRNNQVQLVDIYSADPRLADGDLVVLQDPAGLFLASHVVPVVSDNVDEAQAAIINKVSALLTANTLVALNAQSVNEQSSAAAIAKDWLSKQSLK